MSSDPAVPTGRPGPDSAPAPFLSAGVDVERANAARMYDYYLGGAHNFAVDRERADQVIAAMPDAPHMARCNRAYLGRVVRWSLEHGVTQFVDLGSGVPTVGNVHEIALTHSAARVSYVDFEPVAVAHAGEIIGALGTSAVTVTRADVRDPQSVLGAPRVAGLIDFERPVALLAMAVLHFVEGDIADLLGRYRARLAPGSVVAISHTSDDQDDPEVAERVRSGHANYAGSATPVVLRPRADLLRALEGLDVVPPGLVDVVDWPDTGTGTRRASVYGAVGLVH